MASTPVRASSSLLFPSGKMSHTSSDFSMSFIAYSIKKSRLPQKSRFVHQFILTGYNPILIIGAVPSGLPTENALLFPMESANGADHMVSNDSIPQE